MENDHVKDRTEQRSRCAHIKTFGAGRLYCCTLVRHSSTKSLKSSQVYSCLKLLLGHVARIPDHLIPKQFFYGELSQGKRSHGGQKKRYKDMLKASLNTLDIDSTSCFQSLMVDCPSCGWYPPEAFYQLPHYWWKMGDSNASQYGKISCSMRQHGLLINTKKTEVMYQPAPKAQ